MTKLLIKQGRVIDPETKRDEVADVLVIDDKIEQIGQIDTESDMEVIDANGKLVIPGVIDLHVHLRDMEQSYKETVETGTKAALKGGVTTVFAMPNTKPTLDCVDNIQKYQTLIDQTAVIDTYILGSITKGLGGNVLGEIDKYKELGIKFITDDGFDVNDEALLEEAYMKAKENDLIVATHPEIDSIAPDGVMNEGEVSKELGVPGQPNEKEWRAVERGIRLAKKTGARAHMTHLSTKESIALVRKAKQETDLITCDVTPHHFSLTESVVEEKGGIAKVNPPLRTEEDRLAVIEGIKNGTVDAIITDHAPHSTEEKEADIKKAAFGFTGLEILVPATLTELHHKQGIDLMKVIELMTLAPAKLADLPSGRLQEGAPADITIIDLETEKEVRREELISKGKITPFEGMKLKGWPLMTIFRGATNN